MSFGGSSSQQSQSGTSSYAPDPTLLGNLNADFSRAEGIANTPYQPYSGQMVAGFTPDQTQAQSAFANIGANQVGSAPLNSAIGVAQGVAGYSPQTIQAGLLSNTDLSPYMNPYQSSVIDSTMSDLNRQHQIQAAANSAQATQAGAFGGSRSAVLQNLDDDSFGRTQASTLASLNQGNFSQAQAAATSDLSRQLAAAQSNQSAGLQGQSLNLGAANALAGMSGQQLSQALQQAGALQTAGDAQQQNQQAALNAAYQQWQLAQQYPFQTQQLLNQTIGTFPNDYGTKTTEGSQSGSSNSFNFGLSGGANSTGAWNLGF